MSEAAGLVSVVSSKVLDSGTYFSFCIDDIWYRTGREPVPFEKGHTVKFIFNEDKYGKQVDLSTLKVKEGKTVTRGGGSSNARKSDYQQKEQYWKDKDLRDIETQKKISMAGALNTAINMITNAIQMEALPAPKGKASARFEAFTAMVQEEADRLYEVIQSTPDNHEVLMQGDIGAEQSTEDFSDLEVIPDQEEEWS